MAHHLRRTDREITDPARIDSLLAEGRAATVGLVDGDAPYVVTLSYGFDAERNRLCFHVARAGRKLDIIERSPKACVSVVIDHGYSEGRCEHPFSSVVMEGTMRVVEDPDDAREAMRTLIGHLESDEHAAEIWERHSLDGDATYRTLKMLVFDIESRTAKEGK